MSDKAVAGYEGPSEAEEKAHKVMTETMVGRQINEINETLMQMDDLLHEGFRVKLAPIIDLAEEDSDAAAYPREVTNTVLQRMLDDTILRAKHTRDRIARLLGEINL